jgi:hypothetical protein
MPLLSSAVRRAEGMSRRHGRLHSKTQHFS